MSAPSLSAYANGISQVSADNLNSFIQWCVTAAQLKAFTPNPAVPGMLVNIEGYTAAGDGGQGLFYWSTTTGTDDGGVTTLVPSGSTAGCWIRLLNSSVANTFQSVINPTGTTSTSGVMMGIAGTLKPANTGTIMVTISGYMSNTSTGGVFAVIRYGTGAAPANGTANSGTGAGGAPQYNPSVASTQIPFSVNAIISGLTIGISVWFDLSVGCNTAAGTASVTAVSTSAYEIK